MTFFGVVHLLPLPGSPRGVSFEDVRRRAIEDAIALVAGGADGIIVENFGDAPFARGRVCAFTVAAMTAIAREIRDLANDRMLGINVLRNDAVSALGVAAAVRADWIRVNVHTGAMVTDQGIIQGNARETLLERSRLGVDVRIAADVLVKHADPLGSPQLGVIAKDTAYRGLADALIVTGTGTGQPHDPERVTIVKDAVPDRPVWVGSGVTLATAPGLCADGAIVGTALHQDANIEAPLDVDRIRAMKAALT